MNNQLIKANPTHVVGATRPVETQGVTKTSRTYVPAPTGEMRKNLHSTLVVAADLATLALEFCGLAICVKSVRNLFTKKKQNE